MVFKHGRGGFFYENKGKKAFAKVSSGFNEGKGYPDHEIIWDDHVGWIEYKAKGGRISPDQQIIIQELRLRDHFVAVCYDMEDVYKTLTQWFIANQLDGTKLGGTSGLYLKQRICDSIP